MVRNIKEYEDTKVTSDIIEHNLLINALFILYNLSIKSQIAVMMKNSYSSLGRSFHNLGPE